MNSLTYECTIFANLYRFLIALFIYSYKKSSTKSSQLDITYTSLAHHFCDGNETMRFVARGSYIPMILVT